MLILFESVAWATTKRVGRCLDPLEMISLCFNLSKFVLVALVTTNWLVGALTPPKMVNVCFNPSKLVHSRNAIKF